MKRGIQVVRGKFAGLRSNSLHANSLYIMIAQGLIAAFGFLFWLIAARLFDSEAVGVVGSLISVATLVTNISLLGFNNSLVRFLPKAADKNALINTSMTVVIAASLISTILYVCGIRFFSPDLAFVTHEPVLLGLFLLSMTLVAVNTFTDSVFLANRATKYNIWIYLAYSVLRVAAPFALVGLGVMGLFAAHMTGIVAAVVLSFYFMAHNLDWKPKLQIDMPTLRSMTGYSLANYVAGFLWSAPLLAAPLIVLNELGKSPAAYFYMAIMVINILFIIPTATSQSLFAEGAHAKAEQLYGLARKALRSGLLITSGGVAAILLAGKLAMSSFGAEYAAGATTLLYVLAVSGILVAINMTANTILKVQKRLRILVGVNIVGATSAIALFAPLATYGLIGIGYAYLLGQALMTGAYAALFLFERLKREQPLSANV